MADLKEYLDLTHELVELQRSPSFSEKDELAFVEKMDVVWDRLTEAEQECAREAIKRM